jgi:hypothetical protein
LLFGVGVGEGVGEAFFRLGEVVGDGAGVGFFFELFLCLRTGVGDGAKTFLIFVPSDSSAAGAVEAPDKSPRSNKQRIIVLMSIDIVGAFCETPLQASGTDALQFTLLSVESSV